MGCKTDPNKVKWTEKLIRYFSSDVLKEECSAGVVRVLIRTTGEVDNFFTISFTKRDRVLALMFPIVLNKIMDDKEAIFVDHFSL